MDIVFAKAIAAFFPSFSKELGKHVTGILHIKEGDASSKKERTGNVS